jgi:endonuclease-8
VPEGHTIHRLARDQRRDLAGAPVRASSVQARFAEGAARLDGQVLERIEPYGKHLFHWFASGDVLHVHLGLIGKFRRQPAPAPEPVGEVRLRLEGVGAAWDLSGPMVCRIVTPDDVPPVIAKLGPDPLRRDADPSAFATRLRRSAKPVADLLLDQSVVAGVGNVYRAEVLFLCGIHPMRPGRSLTDDEVACLWSTIVAELKSGLRRNKIVTVPPAELDVPVRSLRSGEGVYAYKREICRRCGSAIAVHQAGGRRVWACETCQR